MSDEKIQRVSCLAEQILEMCDEEDVSVLDKVDALTVVMSHMLARLKDNARKGVTDGVLKKLKAELKK